MTAEELKNIVDHAIKTLSKEDLLKLWHDAKCDEIKNLATEKFPIKLNKDISEYPIIHGFITTGWSSTDSVLNMFCPKCGASPFYNCITPSGRRSMRTHKERMWELRRVGYTGNQGIKMSKQDVLNRIETLKSAKINKIKLHKS